MSDEQVERVARAIAARNTEPWEAYVDDARAAIAAMRERPLIPNEETAGKTATRLLDQWSTIERAEDQMPYHETMAFLGKPNSAGWIWAREVRYERDFDDEKERTRNLAVECIAQKDAEIATMGAPRPGFVCVPLEPTPTMTDAAWRSCQFGIGIDIAREIYKAMVSAAPPMMP